MSMITEVETLVESLAEFGLCPTEWVITQQESLIYKIQNKEEPQFFFKGNISFENGRKKWGSICLAGL